jgi:hypothetical protein
MTMGPPTPWNSGSETGTLRVKNGGYTASGGSGAPDPVVVPGLRASFKSHGDFGIDSWLPRPPVIRHAKLRVQHSLLVSRLAFSSSVCRL